ncbi:MAG: 4Fe-4S dicluster domain-containing protein [Firmicutes bacterium]|jgi:ferredoxin|nr:4Fe-4S dicluster domain-containing protein [Bacillota bacterium]
MREFEGRNGQPMRKLNQGDLPLFLAEVAQEREVFAPEKEDGAVVFLRWSPGDPVFTDYFNTAVSPKGFVFPQSQKVLDFEMKKGSESITAAPPPIPRAVFGARPCDLAALELLDLVFLSGEYRDDSYARERESVLWIGLACVEPGESCFCNVFGITPGSSKGADIMLYPIPPAWGGGFAVEGLTALGEELLATKANLFVTLPDPDGAAVVAEYTGRMTSLARHLDLGNLPESLPTRFNDPYWARSSERCLECGLCTYTCPTCHCFGVSDIPRGTAGRRVRSWDSCMFSEFLLMAGGHNPRPTRAERVRQRFMHKLAYAPERYGRAFCVGCGRCVAMCPAGLSMATVLHEIGGVRCE